MRTVFAPSEWIFSAAVFISLMLLILTELSISASGMLGVTISALGRISSRRSSVEFFKRVVPSFERITGSTTSFSIPYRSIFSATVSTIFSLESIPSFAASQPMSLITASNWSPTNCSGRSCMPLTSKVFWAVTEVSTESPYTPRVVKVLRSAWIPAPPLESDPATVSALGIFSGT